MSGTAEWCDAVNGSEVRIRDVCRTAAFPHLVRCSELALCSAKRSFSRSTTRWVVAGAKIGPSETAHSPLVNLVMPLPDSALTDDDYDFLQSVLDSLQSENAMNLEMVDGFFAALICAPQLVMPSGYLPGIVGGEDEVYENLEQVERFMTVLMAHWTILLTHSEPMIFICPSC